MARAVLGVAVRVLLSFQRHRARRYGIRDGRSGCVTVKKEAVILGISFDTPADNKALADKYGFNFPLLCDTDRKIGAAYGPNADRNKGAQRVGVVIAKDGTIVEWHEKVDARSWPAQVVQTV